MPTYEYHCRTCGDAFSVRERIADHDPDRVICPKCQSKDVERVISGFYARVARKS